MDWTTWWYLASVLVAAVGSILTAKAYYRYYRNQPNGMPLGLLLFGFFLAAIGLLSLLAHLVYGLVTN